MKNKQPTLPSDTTQLPYDKQLEMLNQCASAQADVQTVLAQIGLSLDSLNYRNTPLLPDLSKVDYQYIDDIEIPSTTIPAISFFSGAGGMDIGFKYAGFDNQASVEFNEIFCNTLRLNNPDKLVIGPPAYSGDVRNFSEIVNALNSKLSIKAPFEGIFHGGPPCQSFSMAANQRFAKGDENFKRVGFSHTEYGNLLFDYVRLIATFRPRVFVIENVPGLKQMDGGQQLALALKPLEEMGYKIAEPTIVNAADYGVPQMRQRCFVVGARDVAQAFVFPTKDAKHIPCYKALERPLEGVANNETREHKAASLLRYGQLEYGQRDQLGRVDRLNPLKPSKTVIAGGLKGGGRSHLHPLFPRTLSARESARLQTFPDNYVFTGPSARQFTQIGNAVPPMLAYRMAKAIREQIFEVKRSSVKAVKPAKEFKEPQLAFTL
jgi:DNA (cytosine-5)-methyltransferase 1